MTDLLPCPFCGGSDVGVDNKICDNENSGFACSCLSDNCHGNIYVVDGFYGSEEIAIAAWNTRAPAA